MYSSNLRSTFNTKRISPPLFKQGWIEYLNNQARSSSNIRQSSSGQAQISDNQVRVKLKYHNQLLVEYFCALKIVISEQKKFLLANLQPFFGHFGSKDPSLLPKLKSQNFYKRFEPWNDDHNFEGIYGVACLDFLKYEQTNFDEIGK